MKYFAILGVSALLAGCGADGAPTRPGINLGLSIGPGGIRPTIKVKTEVGPVDVTIGS